MDCHVLHQGVIRALLHGPLAQELSRLGASVDCRSLYVYAKVLALVEGKIFNENLPLATLLHIIGEWAVPNFDTLTAAFHIQVCLGNVQWKRCLLRPIHLPVFSGGGRVVVDMLRGGLGQLNRRN